MTNLRIPSISEKRLKIIRAVGELGVQMAATKLQLQIGYIYQVFYKERIRLQKAQNYVNHLNIEKKKYPRVRKLLTYVNENEKETPN